MCWGVFGGGGGVGFVSLVFPFWQVQLRNACFPPKWLGLWLFDSVLLPSRVRYGSSCSLAFVLSSVLLLLLLVSD